MINNLSGKERSIIIEDLPLLHKDHDGAIRTKRFGIASRNSKKNRPMRHYNLL